MTAAVYSTDEAVLDAAEEAALDAGVAPVVQPDRRGLRQPVGGVLRLPRHRRQPGRQRGVHRRRVRGEPVPHRAVPPARLSGKEGPLPAASGGGGAPCQRLGGSGRAAHLELAQHRDLRVRHPHARVHEAQLLVRPVARGRCRPPPPASARAGRTRGTTRPPPRPASASSPLPAPGRGEVHGVDHGQAGLLRDDGAAGVADEPAAPVGDELGRRGAVRARRRPGPRSRRAGGRRPPPRVSRKASGASASISSRSARIRAASSGRTRRTVAVRAAVMVGALVMSQCIPEGRSSMCAPGPILPGICPICGRAPSSRLV